MTNPQYLKPEEDKTNSNSADKKFIKRFWPIIICCILILFLGVYSVFNLLQINDKEDDKTSPTSSNSSNNSQSTSSGQSQQSSDSDNLSTSSDSSSTLSSTETKNIANANPVFRLKRLAEFGKQDLSSSFESDCQGYEMYVYPASNLDDYSEVVHIAPKNQVVVPNNQNTVDFQGDLSKFITNADQTCSSRFRGASYSNISKKNIDFKMSNTEYVRPFYYTVSSGVMYTEARAGIIGVSRDKVFIALDDDVVLDFKGLVRLCGTKDSDGNPTSRVVSMNQEQVRCYEKEVEKW